MSWLESNLSRIAEAYAPDLRLLAILRIGFGVWVIVFPVDVTWISHVPAAFFNPRPGLFAFMNGPPDDSVLVALTIVKAMLGVLLTIGIVTVPVSIALSVSLVVSSGISYSFSKVDHFILFELAPIFLAFAGWGWTWSTDSLLRRSAADRWRKKCGAPSVRGIPVVLFAMTVGWAMLTAAVPKLAGGWLDPSRYASRGYLARDIAIGEKLGPLGPSALKIDSGLIWKILDYSTLIAEGGLIFVVLFPVVFRLWLLLVASFHIGVYLMLGINFVDYVMVYAVFFSPVFAWLGEKVSRGLWPRQRSALPPLRDNG